MKITTLFLLLFLTNEVWGIEASKNSQAWVIVQNPKIDKSWRALAFEETLMTLLPGFKTVKGSHQIPLPLAHCASNDTHCLLEFLEKEHFDFAVFGELKSQELSLKTYETLSKTVVSQQTISFEKGLSLEEFKHQIFQLVKPYIQTGGLRDRQIKWNESSKEVDQNRLLLFLAGILWALNLLNAIRFLVPDLRELHHSDYINFLPFFSKAAKKLVSRSLLLLLFAGLPVLAAFKIHLRLAPPLAFALALGIFIQLEKIFKSSTKLDQKIFSKIIKIVDFKLVSQLLALALVVFLVTQSIAYRDTYEKHISTMKKKIEEQQRRIQQQERSNG